MIRSTRNGLNELISQNLFKLTARLSLAEEQAVTGRKINRPSDNPPVIAESHRLYTSIEDQSYYQKNAEYADSLLAVMDTALSNASDIIVRARELAVAMAGDTVDANTRTVAATEVAELYTSMIDQANAEVSGRYLFSGASYQTAAFSNTGLYQGDNDTPSTRVGENQWVQTGYDGSQIFQSTVDVFAVLNNLLVGLQTDNDVTIETALGDLDLATTQISTWHSTVGSEVNTATDALEVAESLDQVLSQRLEEIVNIDPTTAYLDLSDLRNAYEAVLQVSSSSSKTTLFDLI